MDSTSLPVLSSPSDRPTLDQCIKLWIETKSDHTNSEQTNLAYVSVMRRFREALQARGIDLLSNAKIVSLAAQDWARIGQGGKVASASTYNQRVAILSSFYRYAIGWGLCMSNPIDLIERKPRENPDAAMPMDAKDVMARLRSIDRSSIEGQRSFALLLVAVTTGRRVNELAAMRWGHITISGQALRVIWPHCKGGKVMHDILAPKTAKAVMDYLHAIYGEHLEKITAESPIWVSQSRNNKGGPISDQAIADICKEVLGTSKVHTLRHTFTVIMDDLGASVPEISERLGHSDIKTTSIYLKRLRSAKNPYASQIEDILGIE